VRRQLLGDELRRLREACCLRLEDVAERLGVAPSTLSRIETGRAPTRTSYLHLMLDLYGVNDPDRRRLLADVAREGQRKGWWADYRDVLPAGSDTFLGLEAAASYIRSFSVLAVPDLVQTERYARAVCRARNASLTKAQLARLVAVQLRRQERALHSGRCQLELLIDESSLLRRIGSGDVMAEQLEHLAALAAGSSAVIRVVSLAREHSLLPLPFVVLSFSSPAAGDVGCQGESLNKVKVTKRPSEVRALLSGLAGLSRMALSPGRFRRADQAAGPTEDSRGRAVKHKLMITMNGRTGAVSTSFGLGGAAVELRLRHWSCLEAEPALCGRPLRGGARMACQELGSGAGSASPTKRLSRRTIHPQVSTPRWSITHADLEGLDE
jgi:transcriptional regulator with XRE-family HTH domain